MKLETWNDFKIVSFSEFRHDMSWFNIQTCKNVNDAISVFLNNTLGVISLPFPVPQTMMEFYCNKNIHSWLIYESILSAGLVEHSTHANSLFLYSILKKYHNYYFCYFAIKKHRHRQIIFKLIKLEQRKTFWITVKIIRLGIILKIDSRFYLM